MDALPLDPGREESELTSSLSTVVCWRCGKDVPADLAQCPYCLAAFNGRSASAQEWKPVDQDSKSLTRLMLFFAAMLGISVLTGLMQHLHAATAPRHHLKPGERLSIVAVLEAIDTILILAAWAWIGLRQPEPRQSFIRRVVSWAAFMPALAVALGFNVLYHHVLLDQFGVVPKPIQFGQGAVLVGWVLAFCLQPAVMEELFFRYLMFGGLRTVMGGQAVVWVTAVMFAAAHVGVPLSLPVLFVLGLLLGYARLASGGLWLPMFLHFLHNAVVMALNANRF